jgi:hypothetical protein
MTDWPALVPSQPACGGLHKLPFRGLRHTERPVVYEVANASVSSPESQTLVAAAIRTYKSRHTRLLREVPFAQEAERSIGGHVTATVVPRGAAGETRERAGFAFVAVRRLSRAVRREESHGTDASPTLQSSHSEGES